MIKVKNTRIGNYIYDEDNRICIINGFIPFDYSVRCDEEEGCEILIDYYKEKTLYKGYKEDSNLCNSIMLNEEWFLKLGFEKHSTNPFWFRKKQLCISLVGCVELISWDMQIFKIDTKINFVHELQNLFHSLTEEELNIELV